MQGKALLLALTKAKPSPNLRPLTYVQQGLVFMGHVRWQTNHD